jgi:hypothetical protein
MARFQYASMRRFAMGALLYTAERFGKVRVGDFLDAMTGFGEVENERIKRIAEIIRTSTALLWNVQQTNEKDLKKPEELWRFSWDKEEEEQEDAISEEEKSRIEDDLLQILKRKTENGNSNKPAKS